MSLIKKISLFFKKKNQVTAPGNESKVNFHNYIGKFVKQNGADIGESIAVEEARFIVKNSDGFLAIPLEAVVKNTENIEVGDFNREDCLQFGKEWFDRKDTLKFDEKGMMILGNQESQ